MAIDTDDAQATGVEASEKRERKRHKRPASPLADRPYLTVDDLMARYGVSRPTVWSWRRRGILPPGLRFGSLVRFRTEEILEAERRRGAGARG